MKPSAIHPVVSINSIYWYFTADHISDCKQRIIEIITYYYDVSHTCHLWQIFDFKNQFISTLILIRDLSVYVTPSSPCNWWAKLLQSFPHMTHKFSSLCKDYRKFIKLLSQYWAGNTIQISQTLCSIVVLKREVYLIYLMNVCLEIIERFGKFIFGWLGVLSL
jgi:hypothetical protein